LTPAAQSSALQTGTESTVFLSHRNNNARTKRALTPLRPVASVQPGLFRRRVQAAFREERRVFDDSFVCELSSRFSAMALAFLHFLNASSGKMSIAARFSDHA
jgi:hypothetical protein